MCEVASPSLQARGRGAPQHGLRLQRWFSAGGGLWHLLLERAAEQVDSLDLLINNAGVAASFRPSSVKANVHAPGASTSTEPARRDLDR